MVKGIFGSKGNSARIGILGGTFDPVHNGHLAVAEAVLQSLNLDSVLFMPAAQPPHKASDLLTPFDKRSAMLSLALAETSFDICHIEKYISGPSYTIDTLKALQQDYLGSELFFIIGQDSFIEIQTWKEFHLIPQIACLVVVNRPTELNISIEQVLFDYFGQYIAHAGSDMWRLPGQEQGGICFVSMPSVQISSRQIRENCRNELGISSLVPLSVAQYIKSNNLYRLVN